MTTKLILGLVIGVAAGGAATYYAMQSEIVHHSSDAILALSGKHYTLNELPAAAAQGLHDIEMQAWLQKQQLLQGAAGEIYVQTIMKQSGQDRQTVLADILGMEDYSDDALQAFYEENKERIPAEFDEVKEQIRSYLIGQNVQLKRKELIDRLQAEEGLEVLLPQPEAPMSIIDVEGFPMKGNPKAHTMVVKFADYQCPHCKDAAMTLNSLAAEMGDKISMVYIDFPINQSGVSRNVALGAVCAGEQGKFWEYNTAAYQQQAMLTHESPMAIARQLNLDETSFTQCLASDRPEQLVSKGEAEAERLGITGTPAIYVNGRAIRPTNLGDDLKATVKKAAGL